MNSFIENFLFAAAREVVKDYTPNHRIGFLALKVLFYADDSVLTDWYIPMYHRTDTIN